MSNKIEISKFQPSSILQQSVMICQSKEIVCAWKSGFLKSGHILHCHAYIYAFWLVTYKCIHVRLIVYTASIHVYSSCLIKYVATYT